MPQFKSSRIVGIKMESITTEANSDMAADRARTAVQDSITNYMYVTRLILGTLAKLYICCTCMFLLAFWGLTLHKTWQIQKMVMCFLQFPPK